MYQITNKIDGKIYIGVHKTKDLDDIYMGSGTYLKRVQKKYGVENFEKTILKFFDNAEDMFKEEAEIVNSEFLLREDVYNLAKGGRGGNHLPIEQSIYYGKNSKENKLGWFSDESREKRIKTMVENQSGSAYNLELRNEMVDRDRSPEAIAKRKKTYAERGHSQGEKNSQFGTMWITNEAENKKIKKDDLIPEGWRKGRTVNRNSK